MTNAKIKKVNTSIEKLKAQIADFQAKTKEQMAEFQSKMKDLESQKIQYENEEIVAMFRREKLNEDEFATLLQKGCKKLDTEQVPHQLKTENSEEVLLDVED